MSDGFQVSLSALTGLAGTFDSRQQSFRSLGGPLKQSAAAVRTGDATLDSEVQKAVGHCDAVFGQMADALGQFADGLRANAQNYQDVDSQTAESLQSLMPDSAVDSPLVG